MAETLTTTDDEQSTEPLSEQEALEMLEAAQVVTQVLGDTIQALAVWTEKHVCGGFGSEWVDVVCRKDWIRAFLGQ